MLALNTRGGWSLAMSPDSRRGDISTSLRCRASWAMCWQNIVVEGRVESSREGGTGANSWGKV